MRKIWNKIEKILAKIIQKLFPVKEEDIEIADPNIRSMVASCYNKNIRYVNEMNNGIPFLKAIRED